MIRKKHWWILLVCATILNEKAREKGSKKHESVER